nr:flavodoxin [Bacteroidota bacterium]
MNKTGIFYWPKNGNVETCATKIYEQFDKSEIELHSIDEADQVDLGSYKMIIVGGSTVGADVWEKASDNNLWNDFISKFEGKILKDKPVAIFGLGDQILYPDHFVNGMMIIKKEFDKAGARLVGRWPTVGYDFTGSESIENEMFVGLVLDEDQQDELTDERVKSWVSQLRKEAGI